MSPSLGRVRCFAAFKRLLYGTPGLVFGRRIRRSRGKKKKKKCNKNCIFKNIQSIYANKSCCVRNIWYRLSTTSPPTKYCPHPLLLCYYILPTTILFIRCTYIYIFFFISLFLEFPVYAKYRFF